MKKNKSGRKTVPADQKRKPKTHTFAPDITRFLESQPNASATIEQAIRIMPMFKAWRDNEDSD